MRPIKLTMKAFGPYRKENTIDFTVLGGQNFFLVDGATGAGKTTILDAICFALYGEASGSHRTVKGLRCLTAQQKEKTIVDFTFQLGNKTYRICRDIIARKHRDGSEPEIQTNSAELYEIMADGKEEPVAGKIKEVNAKIEGSLGFRCDEFRQVVLIPQNEFQRVLLANSNERQEILSTLFRTDIYRKIADMLENKAEEFEKKQIALLAKQKDLTTHFRVSDSDALADVIAGNEQEREHLAERQQKLQETQQKAQKQLAEGEQLEKTFRQEKAAQENWRNLQAQEREMQERRSKLDAAKRAAALTDIAKQARQMAEKAKDADADAKDATDAHANAQSINTSAEQRLKAQQSPEAQQKREELDALAKELERLAKMSKGLPALRKESQRLTEEAGKAAQAAELAEKNLKDSKEQKDKFQQKALEITKLAERAGEIRLYRQSLQQAAELIQKGQDTQKQLAEAKKKKASADKKVADLRLQADQKRNELQRLRNVFADAQAFALAASLESGKPCPVCGSTEHPHPASPAENAEQIDKGILDQHEKGLEKAEDAWHKAEKEASSLAATCEHLQKQADDLAQQIEQLDYAPKELPKLQQDAEKQAQDAEGAVKRKEKAEKWMKEQEQRISEQEKALADAREQYQKAHDAQTAKETELSVQINQLPEEYRAEGALAKAERQAKRKASQAQKDLDDARDAQQQAAKKLAEAAVRMEEMKKSAESLRAQAAEKAEEFQSRREEQGFATEEEWKEAASGALSTADGREKEEQALADYRDSCLKTKEEVKRLAKETEGKTAPDLAGLQEAVQNAGKEASEAAKRLGELGGEIQQKKDALQQMRKNEQDIKDNALAYEGVERLFRAATGKNTERVSFERYVLHAMLDDVIQAANERLWTMSRKQYRLEHGKANRGNAFGGLDLQIIDAYSGYSRSLSTLSGGETFLASLSLALGLADVVQNYAGGIHLDTIFIDEGFGSLDSETLDIAMRALMDLQKGNRLVGIISHVAELQERIPARLEVTKSIDGGSVAAFHV